MTSILSTQPEDAAVVESRLRIPRTILYYSTFITLGMIQAVVGPTLQRLAANTDSALGGIAIIFLARGFGYMIGSGQLARLYDRLPAHKVFAAGLMLMSVSGFFIPFLPSLWLLAVALFFIGMSESLVDVGGNALLVWVHGRTVAPFMNGLHFFYGFGALLAPIIVAQTLSLSQEIYWAYWAVVAINLPIIFFMLRVPAPVNRVKSEDDGGSRNGIVLIFLISVFFFFHIGVECGFGNWIFSYATRLNLADATTAAYLNSTFWAGMTFGRLIGIPIASRLKPHTILLVDLLGCMASLSVILFFPASLEAVFIGTGGMGLFIASIFATTINFAERRMTLTGKVTGWFFFACNIGGMSVSYLFGPLFESVGPRAMIVTDLIMIAADLILLAILLSYSVRLVKEKS